MAEPETLSTPSIDTLVDHRILNDPFGRAWYGHRNDPRRELPQPRRLHGCDILALTAQVPNGCGARVLRLSSAAIFGATPGIDSDPDHVTRAWPAPVDGRIVRANVTVVGNQARVVRARDPAYDATRHSLPVSKLHELTETLAPADPIGDYLRSLKRPGTHTTVLAGNKDEILGLADSLMNGSALPVAVGTLMYHTVEVTPFPE